ncbi:unnamed protein product, partial [Allacma fusca]
RPHPQIITSSTGDLSTYRFLEGILKDESFDILDGGVTPVFNFSDDNWCLDEDKFLESIRYGDKIPGDTLDEVEVDTTEVIDVDTSEVISYNLTDDVLSPCSASSGSVSSDQYEDHNHNVKVVQLVGILPPGVKVRTGHAIQILQPEEMVEEEVMDASPASASDPTTYHELKLSDEEKRLLSKEGIALPTHYPLTKFEERELKRIRRKIRNKISAQDSRKRKKEYLDKLQQKVQEVEEEKTNLAKKVRSLEIANSKLSAQVKRLQIALTNATKTPPPSTNQGVQHSVVPAATTLLVLILSLALVVLPTVQNKKQADVENAVMSAFDDSNPNTSLPGRSRTMMGVGVSTNKVTRPAYDDWSSEEIDEPLMKIPRFSFQQPGLDKSGSGLNGPGFSPLDTHVGSKMKGLRQGPFYSDLMNELDD